MKLGRAIRRAFVRFAAAGRAFSTFLSAATGVTLAAAGAVMVVAPGSWIFVGLAGLALVAGRSGRIARWLDRGELALRLAISRFRQG